MAFSVPISRTRFATEARVSKMAISTAASRPTISRPSPKLFDKFLASVRDPPMRFARSAAVVTWAPLRLLVISCLTVVIFPELVART